MLRNFIILLIFPMICTAGNIGCTGVQEGIFKIHGLNGSLNTIIRTNEKQTETWGKSSTVVEYDIQWTSDCTYLLFNQKVLKGSDSLLTVTEQDTLYNEIIESNSYWQKIYSTVNGCEPIIKSTYFKVDTLQRYRNLDELEKFKEFKGPTAGGTFVGYNYAVTYKQHSTEMNKYAIAFLEALTINEKSKFKILDNIEFEIDTTQKITLSNCRFNNKYDKEIVAIYSSYNSKEEACVVKAWRFNKLKLKIEEVETDRVKYKEADKRRNNWED